MSREPVEPVENLVRTTLIPEYSDDDKNWFKQAASPLIESLRKLYFGPPSPREFKHSLISSLLSIVRRLTHADCVFVRRLNEDKTLELLGTPLWQYDEHQIGTPPRKKVRGAGLSAWMISAEHFEPKVFPDVHQLSGSEKEAHQASIEQWPDGSPEREFLTAIRREIDIPLIENGKPVGVIVAASFEACGTDDVQRIEQELGEWQEVLASLFVTLYRLGWAFRAFEETVALLQRLTTAVPLRLAAALDRQHLLRQLATLLTCEYGLQWHRTMIFLFDGDYPADAKCEMAIGGVDETSWSREPRRTVREFKSLDEYLQACNDPEYAQDDDLHQCIQKDPWAIPKEAFEQNELLHAVFCRDDEIQETVREGLVLLTPEDEWFQQWIQRDDTIAAVFRKRCDRWLVPLIWLSPEERQPSAPSHRTIGFVLVDNPYAHSLEFDRTIAPRARAACTRLICDLFSGFLATLGPRAASASETVQQRRAPIEREIVHLIDHQDPENWDSLTRAPTHDVFESYTKLNTLRDRTDLSIEHGGEIADDFDSPS